MVLIRVIDWHIDLNLVTAGESLLMDHIGGPAWSAACIPCGGDDLLVFRKRLFRDERAWHVQLTERVVMHVVAKRPDVSDDVVDLLVAQRVAKGGHNLRKAEAVSTVHNDSLVA